MCPEKSLNRVKYIGMSKDAYEILLLEIRQCLRDAETELLNTNTIDIKKFKRLKSLKALIKETLISYRLKKSKNPETIAKLING